MDATRDLPAEEFIRLYEQRAVEAGDLGPEEIQRRRYWDSLSRGEKRAYYPPDGFGSLDEAKLAADAARWAAS